MTDYLERFRELGKVVTCDNYRDYYKEILDLTNYDESKVPEYTLPSPLDVIPGRRVKSAMDWMNWGRPAVFRMLQDEMYGKVIPRPDQLSFELLSYRDDALDGTAIRKEVRVHCSMRNGRCFQFTILFYAPLSAREMPVPAFVGLNFKGNEATTDEEDVRMTSPTANGRYQKEGGADLNRRGLQVERWCFRELVARGFASATVCYEDIFPDRTDGWENSALTLFEDNLKGYKGPHEHYTSIGVWSWGLSRMMDYMETEPLVDAARVGVHGHSRLGKTALWAGACDQRFVAVYSNCSGCGGAALAKRKFGETYLFIDNNMSHWFTKSLHKYNGCEETMPFDQHWLVALSAPRLVSVASATEDLWADPKGEFLAAKGAEEVYRLFGSEGLPAVEPPPPGTCLNGDINYHCRIGKHNQLLFDWEHYMQILARKK